MANVDMARTRLVSDGRTLVADAEELTKAVSDESREKIASMRPRVEDAIGRARARLAELEVAVEAKAARLANDTNAYAHEHPWKTAGMAAASGTALGAIMGVLLTRR